MDTNITKKELLSLGENAANVANAHTQSPGIKKKANNRDSILT